MEVGRRLRDEVERELRGCCSIQAKVNLPRSGDGLERGGWIRMYHLLPDDYNVFLL